MFTVVCLATTETFASFIMPCLFILASRTILDFVHPRQQTISNDNHVTLNLRLVKPVTIYTRTEQKVSLPFSSYIMSNDQVTLRKGSPSYLICLPCKENYQLTFFQGRKLSVYRILSAFTLPEATLSYSKEVIA